MSEVRHTAGARALHATTQVGAALTATSPEHVVALRRDDLEACRAGYRRASAGRGVLPLYLLGFGGLAGSVLLLQFGARIGWPDSIGWPTLAGGWAVMLLAWWRVVQRDRQLRARYQLFCPACGAALLSAADLVKGRPTPVDLALATGRCPECHTEVLAP
ncbi:MAG: hypothetical protein MUF21_15305 [Gemmatimonadaceae bacterium]|nr:hypothetical protein [Gemmatimonadaceae bacterium]